MEEHLDADATARLRSLLANPDGKHVAAILGAVAALLDAGETVTSNAITTALGFDSAEARAWIGDGHAIDPGVNSVETGVNTADPGINNFPQPPLSPWLFQGRLGDMARKIVGLVESHPANVMAHLLAGFANLVAHRGTVLSMGGPAQMFTTSGSKRLSAGIRVLIGGPSSTGRKGTAAAAVERVLRAADDSWNPQAIYHGSGPALFDSCADTIIDDDGNTIYQGAEDKRVYLRDEEASGFFKVGKRENDSLTEKFRTLCDIEPGRSASTKTRGGGTRTASDPLFTFIGHAVLEALHQLIGAGSLEAVDGTLNRMLFVLSSRSKTIHDSAKSYALLETTGAALATEIAATRSWCLSIIHGEDGPGIELNDTASTFWAAYREYRLPTPAAPIMAVMTARAEETSRRIALVYAIADRSPVITLWHLLAGIAWLDVHYASAALIYDSENARRNQSRDAKASAVLRALDKRNGTGTRTDIAHAANCDGDEMERVVQLLTFEGAMNVREEQNPNGGPRRQVLTLVADTMRGASTPYMSAAYVLLAECGATVAPPAAVPADYVHEDLDTTGIDLRARFASAISEEVVNPGIHGVNPGPDVANSLDEDEVETELLRELVR